MFASDGSSNSLPELEIASGSRHLAGIPEMQTGHGTQAVIRRVCEQGKA
jgi:hypothetical protein